MFFSKSFAYLYSMKNENDMEMILAKYGFEKGEEPDTWLKDEWEVRLYGSLVEISEDPEKTSKPRYYMGDLNLIDLATLLDELA